MIAFLLLCLAPQQPPDPRPLDAAVRAMPGYRPADEASLCSDGEFLRRAMLDLVGYPPNAGELKAFVESGERHKRRDLIDRLLDSERFADFWARRFMDVFFGNYRQLPPGPLASEPRDVQDRAMDAFKVWLREGLRKNRPWSAIVKDLLEAEGDLVAVPQLAYKLAQPDVEKKALRHFMSTDFSCTKCHDSAFDKWRVEDGLALAGFSSGRKIRVGTLGLGVTEEVEPRDRAAFRKGEDPVVMRNTGPPPLYHPMFIDGQEPKEGEVLSRAFARFMISPKNERFRESVANRVWTWLLGRGVVHPADDFNLKNKPQSRILLERLRKGLVAEEDSLRSLIRWLCATEAYQRDCRGKEGPKFVFATARIRPLSPEQLLGSLEVALDGRPRLDVEAAARLGVRAPRPPRSANETAEWPADAPLLLWISDGEEVAGRLRESRVLRAIRERAPEEQLRELFRAVLSRDPDDAEIQRLGTQPLEEVAWILINSTEFLMRH